VFWSINILMTVTLAIWAHDRHTLHYFLPWLPVTVTFTRHTAADFKWFATATCLM
jgi:hypothetical protein